MSDLEQMMAGVFGVDAAKLREAMRAPVVEPTAQEMADYHADMAAGHGVFSPMDDDAINAMAAEYGGDVDPDQEALAGVIALL